MKRVRSERSASVRTRVFRQWTLLPSEMRGEVAAALDPCSRRALAMTSRANWATWNNEPVFFSTMVEHGASAYLHRVWTKWKKAPTIMFTQLATVFYHLVRRRDRDLFEHYVRELAAWRPSIERRKAVCEEAIMRGLLDAGDLTWLEWLTTQTADLFEWTNTSYMWTCDEIIAYITCSADRRDPRTLGAAHEIFGRAAGVDKVDWYAHVVRHMLLSGNMSMALDFAAHNTDLDNVLRRPTVFGGLLGAVMNEWMLTLEDVVCVLHGLQLFLSRYDMVTEWTRLIITRVQSNMAYGGEMTPLQKQIDFTPLVTMKPEFKPLLVSLSLIQ